MVASRRIAERIKQRTYPLPRGNKERPALFVASKIKRNKRERER